MGELAFAAKITHVPTLLLSEQDGPLKGCRQQAIDGLREIGRRIRALGVDTVVVADVHWLVNAGYHINAKSHFKGVYASNEFPQFIDRLEYDLPGNPELGNLIAKIATAKGSHTLSHQVEALELEYGTLVPMHFMNPEGDLKSRLRRELVHVAQHAILTLGWGSHSRSGRGVGLKSGVASFGFAQSQDVANRNLCRE